MKVKPGDLIMRLVMKVGDEETYQLGMYVGIYKNTFMDEKDKHYVYQIEWFGNSNLPQPYYDIPFCNIEELMKYRKIYLKQKNKFL